MLALILNDMVKKGVCDCDGGNHETFFESFAYLLPHAGYGSCKGYSCVFMPEL